MKVLSCQSGKVIVAVFIENWISSEKKMKVNELPRRIAAPLTVWLRYRLLYDGKEGAKLTNSPPAHNSHRQPINTRLRFLSPLEEEL